MQALDKQLTGGHAPHHETAGRYGQCVAGGNVAGRPVGGGLPLRPIIPRRRASRSSRSLASVRGCLQRRGSHTAQTGTIRAAPRE